jgi:molybdate transport system substrate-binding protein
MHSAIKMLSSMATKPLLSALVNAYTAEQAMTSTNEKNAYIALQSDGGVNVVKRVTSGETADWLVLASDAVANLAEKGFVDAASAVDLFESSMAVAMPDGATAVDIGSEAALKRVVLDAESIGYSTGPSGAHLMRVFARWGITADIAAKLVQAPPGVPVGAMLQQGRVALGFQQLSELQDVSGIKVLGELPSSVQSVTTFAMAMLTQSDHIHAYARWREFVVSPARAETIRTHGMQPA